MLFDVKSSEGNFFSDCQKEIVWKVPQFFLEKFPIHSIVHHPDVLQYVIPYVLVSTNVHGSNSAALN